MLLGDVDDLVGEHAGEFGLVLEVGQGALGDVHEAARRRERVHGIGIEDDERPADAGTAADLRQRRADEGHVAVHRLVLHHAVAGSDALADLGAELGLLGIGHLDVAHLVGALDGPAQLAELFGAGQCRPGQGHAKSEDHECSSLHADAPWVGDVRPSILSDREPERVARPPSSHRLARKGSTGRHGATTGDATRTSNTCTARVLPLTVTSPSGRRS